MHDLLLSLFQAMQLLALGPCLFMVAFLLLTVRRPAKITVPCLYFLSLSASFLLPLLPLLGNPAAMLTYRGALLFTESLTPALSFLLIMQCLHGRSPAPVFWLVLAIPMLGGSSFIYGALYLEEVCLSRNYCLPAASLKTLYHLLSSGLIFLLLLVYYARQSATFPAKDRARRHQYWLVMAILMLSLQLMAVDLAAVTHTIGVEQAENARVILRIGCVYLMLTSIFRVFSGAVDIDKSRLPTLAPSRQKPNDGWIIEKIERAMTRDFAYRESCTLEGLAAKLHIPEHQISRVINTHFGKGFSEYLNERRIHEAKARLAAESTAVTTIAYDVGFGSIASFNRVFKEMTGQTPSQYRAGQREDATPAAAS